MINEFNLNKIIIKTSPEFYFSNLNSANVFLLQPNGKNDFFNFLKIIFDESAAEFYGNILW
jgi:hypothetical protein